MTVIGAVVIVGWGLHVHALESIAPHLVAMMPNAALCFVASGVALLSFGGTRDASLPRRALVLGLSALVGTIGVLTILEYVTGADLGLDQLLFRDLTPAVRASAPGRMSAWTAIAFIIAPAGLASLRRGSARAVQLAASGVLVLGLTALLSYIYGDTLSRLPGSAHVAVPTTVAFVLLGGALLLSRPDEGLVGGLLANSPGGLMARWLLSFVFIALPLLGGLRLAGQQSGLFGARLGVGIMVLSSLVMLTVVIGLTASRLTALGQERTLALTQLARSEARLRRLLEHLVRVQETERRRLAADLHDDALPALAAVGLQLELARSQCDDVDVCDRLAQAEAELRAGGQRLRHLAFDLRPEALAVDGIGSALRQRLERMRGLGRLDYELYDRVGRHVPAAVAEILYRISVEALNNVMRHAQATQVRVTLERRDGRYGVTVSDDGVGMVAPETRAGHMGLPMMRERAELAGGALQITSRPGAGTTLEAWVPAELSPGAHVLI